MIQIQHAHVESNSTQFDFERRNIGMDTRSPSLSVRSFTPSKLVRAIKTKSSRLGLGEGKHLLNAQIRRNERHQRLSEQLTASEIQSATSQTSIYSLMVSQTDQDNSSISSFIGSNCTEIPFPTILDALKPDLSQGYNLDDKESPSKISDEFPCRRHVKSYRSGVRGTHALLRLAHLGKSNKLVEPIHLPSSLSKSSSYLSSRFVVSNLAF